MENKEFFDTIMDAIGYLEEYTGFSTSKNTFLSITKQYGYPDTCLDAYDEKYDYKKVFLSHYYYEAWYDGEMDFDGKPLATLASSEIFCNLEKIMKKRPAVAAYLKGSVSLKYLVELKEKYGLV